jgi:hypothetical protein
VKACLGVALLALLLRAALLPVRPIPLPSVHDEFSYLLGAETFRLGRLANPPHPMWIHFETFHEIFQPTYASKYPPGQALLMALGWRLFGHPWFGVWLSCGLMCGALCWMLQGFVPGRYAVLGGLMAAAQWSLAGYWIDSYWGGALAAAAGALVIGAVPRLMRRPAAGVAAALAIGCLGLANTRPYEGLLTALAAGVVILRGRKRVTWHLRAALPALAILLAGAAAMAYYNHRVTGHALLMPYSVYQKTYAASPVFWLIPAGPPPVYHHEVLRRFWVDWDKSLYTRARAFPPIVVELFVLGVLPFFLTPISGLAALAAVLLRRGRKVRRVLVMLGIITAGFLLERYSLPHYFAPATGLILVLVMLGVQWIQVRVGRAALAVFVLLFFAGTVLDAVRGTREAGHPQFAARRQEMLRRLESMPGRQLVIVRYRPDHDVHEEWVFNHADIDGSAVVWARDMGDAGNRELLDYYRGRRVWLLEPDGPHPSLQALPRAAHSMS